MTSLKKIFRNLIKEDQEQEDPGVTLAEIPDENISVDRQILRAIMNAERNAVQVGKQQQGFMAIESVNKAKLNYLFEQESSLPPFDVGTFAIEIMRVINNFDTILDVPAAVYNRSKQYVDEKYGAEMSQSFTDYLKNEFNFEVTNDKGIAEDPPPQHFAVGAMGGGGGAA